MRRACTSRRRRARSLRARGGSARARSVDCGARGAGGRAARPGSRGGGCRRARSPCRPGSRSSRRAAPGSRAKRALRRFRRPSQVIALPVRAVRVGQDAVEHVDARLDHLEDPLGIADPHEVARLARPGAAARASRSSRTSRSRSSPIARPPIALPSKSSSTSSSTERRRSSRSVPPWTDREAELAVGALGVTLAPRPVGRPAHRVLELAAVDARRAAPGRGTSRCRCRGCAGSRRRARA